MLVYQIVYGLLLRGALRVRRSLPVAVIGCVVASLVLVAWVRDAQAASRGYCIRTLNLTDQGYRVMVENVPGCDIYRVMRDYPQRDERGNALPQQVQLRSIFAANLVKQDDGTFAEGSVKRRCTKDGRPSPDSDAEELKNCSHLTFFYALQDVAFVVPKARVFTPAEMAVQRAAEEAEQAKQKAAEAKAAEEARLESEAYRRAAEAESKLKLEQEKSAGLQAALDDIADKAYRVATFPALVGGLICVLAYALLISMLAAHYRFRLRPLTVEGYGYPNPLVAVRELNMKLLAVRDEVVRWRKADADRRSAEATEQKRENQQLQSLRDRLTEAEAETVSLKKENGSLKSNLEALRKARASESSGSTPAVRLLEERLSTATTQYNELDALHKGLQETRRNQALQIQALQKENLGLRETVERLEAEKQGLSDRLRDIQDKADAQTRNSWVMSPLTDPDEAVTQVRTPSRNSVTPDSVADAVGFARGEPKPQEPEEIFASLAQELTDAREERDLFRGALVRISGLLSWVEGLEAQSLEDLRDKVGKIVGAVTDACRLWVSSGQSASGRDARVESEIPLVSTSDIVRIAKMSDLLQERAVDIEAFRGIMSDVAPSSVEQCLKVCINEWSIRSERGESLAYALDEPHEAFALNRFLLSRLVNNPGIHATVTSRFAEAVDRVHLACAPEFSRRAVSGSIPPSAVPQAAG